MTCSHITITKQLGTDTTVTEEDGSDTVATDPAGTDIAPEGIEICCKAEIIVFDFIYDGDWSHGGQIIYAAELAP